MALQKESKRPDTVLVKHFPSEGEAVGVKVKLGVYGWCGEDGSGTVIIDANNAERVLVGDIVFQRPLKEGERSDTSAYSRWAETAQQFFV